jgi:hypothetical protein
MVVSVAPEVLVKTVTRREPAAPAALVGARIGATIPQPFNQLSSSFLVEVEGAYQLPFWRRRLGLFADAAYTQPSLHGTRTADPRVVPNGGVVTWDVSLEELSFALGAQLRWSFGRWLVPYAGAGARLTLTRTTLTQKAGTADFGTLHEESTRVGFLGRLGCGLHLGPGDVVLELQVEYTTIDHLLTGDGNTGQLAIQLGYLIRI